MNGVSQALPQPAIFCFYRFVKKRDLDSTARRYILALKEIASIDVFSHYTVFTVDCTDHAEKWPLSRSQWTPSIFTNTHELGLREFPHDFSMKSFLLWQSAMATTDHNESSNEQKNRRAQLKFDTPDITGIASGTPEVFVINVAGAAGKKRRRHMQDELGKAGLGFTLWPAVRVGKDVTDEDYFKALAHGNHILNRTDHYQISLSEFALALSHRSLYDHLILSGKDSMLIMEDDLKLVPNFKQKLLAALSSAPSDFDWLKLECSDPSDENHTACAFAATSGVPGVEWKLQIPASLRSSTGAYVVSAKGARLLRCCNTPLWINSDGAMDIKHIQAAGCPDPRPYFLDNGTALTWQLRWDSTFWAGGRH
jgi:GR25 family glycosyltransferase involved in LPS biosynthesis